LRTVFALTRIQRCVSGLDRCHGVDDRVRDSPLEHAVRPALELVQRCLRADLAQRRVDLEQVGDARPHRGGHGRVGVGGGACDLPAHCVRWVEEQHRVARTFHRDALAHLFLRRVEPHDPCTDGADQRGRHGEDVAALGIDALSEVAAEFDVLPLILADRNEVGVVEEDVRRLQDGVGEDPGIDAFPPLGLTARLELSHPVEPSHRSQGLEDPAQLGVCRHVRLHEDLASLWVDPAGDVHRRQLQRQRTQTLGIRMLGQRVQVDDAEEVLVPILVAGPVAQGAEIVTEVQTEVRLDTAEHPGARGHVVGHRRARRGVGGHLANYAGKTRACLGFAARRPPRR
jgi:hypothetical protein